MQRRAIRFAAAIIVALHGSVLAEEPGFSPIHINNHTDGETVRFPVPLLRGTVEGDDPISIVNLSRDPPVVTRGIVHNGRFKLLCELLPGVNRLQLKAGKSEAFFNLNYAPQTNNHIVRIIYMTDKTGSTLYQTPGAEDVQNFRGRLGTAMKLMQTMTAERMHDLGFGHRTFNLEMNEATEVKVHLFQGGKLAEEYYKLSDQLWYREVATEVEKTYPTTSAKNVIIAAYTRFDAETGKTLGHTALGGGGQALFGSANLFTWPTDIGEAQGAFMDVTPIDPKTITSDSIGRNTYWGAASTTLGATLHELGHAFGLPHTNARFDIMTRGFDHFNRVFTFVDPVSAANRTPIEFTDNEVAAFAPISAAALITSPWLAIDSPLPARSSEIAVVFSKKQRRILAASPQGIRYIGGRKEGDMRYFAAPPAGQPAPLMFATPLEPFAKQIGEKGSLVILDGAGNRREISIADLPEETVE